MAVTEFFGEDLGLGDCTALAVHPNADAARANFLGGNLTSWGTETFDAIPDGTLPPILLTFGAFTMATLTGAGGFVNGPPYPGACAPGFDTNGTGRFGIGGGNYFDCRSDTFVITFSTPIGAMGFYGIDIGDFNGQLRLTLTHTDSSTTVLTVPATVLQPSGGVCYYAFLLGSSDPLVTTITFSNTNPGFDVFGFDSMTVGVNATVPPPTPTTRRGAPWDPRHELRARIYKKRHRRVTLNGIETEVVEVVPGVNFGPPLKPKKVRMFRGKPR